MMEITTIQPIPGEGHPLAYFTQERVEEHGDLVFFVMAYIEGQTLTERVATRGPLPVRDGVRVLRQIAWALVHAHGQGVVHRDIKPDNIMLEEGSGRVVVTDFGIAVVGRSGPRCSPWARSSWGISMPWQRS